MAACNHPVIKIYANLPYFLLSLPPAPENFQSYSNSLYYTTPTNENHPTHVREHRSNSLPPLLLLLATARTESSRLSSSRAHVYIPTYIHTLITRFTYIYIRARGIWRRAAVCVCGAPSGPVSLSPRIVHIAYTLYAAATTTTPKWETRVVYMEYSGKEGRSRSFPYDQGGMVGCVQFLRYSWFIFVIEEGLMFVVEWSWCNMT